MDFFGGEVLSVECTDPGEILAFREATTFSDFLNFFRVPPNHTTTFPHLLPTTQQRRSLSHATMGTGKKEAARKERQGKTGDGMANVKVKGENFYRYVMRMP
jgi:hypothetical protein